ncbi:hypothetical protein Tco_1377964 [Tanacetum coccineum]
MVQQQQRRMIAGFKKQRSNSKSIDRLVLLLKVSTANVIFSAAVDIISRMLRDCLLLLNMDVIVSIEGHGY